MKIPAMKIASKENPTCGNSSGNNCFATNEKKLSLKSKIIKIKASGIVTLQKSSTLYQNYCQS